MKNTIKYIAVFILTLTIFNCSKDDDVNDPYPINFYYPIASIDTQFYNLGSSGIPVIDWQENSGTFLLEENYPGISINTTSGVLSWNQDLPLGDNIINIKASNSGGNIVSELLIRNVFNNQFICRSYLNMTTDTYNTFRIDLFNDGTIDYFDGGLPTSGNWILNDNGSVYCLIDNSIFQTELSFEITYGTDVTPEISGVWQSVDFPNQTGRITGILADD